MTNKINKSFEEITCSRPINSAFSFEQLYIDDFDRLITIIGVNHNDEIKCNSTDKLNKPISIAEYCEFSLKSSDMTKLLLEANPREKWVNQIENYDDKFLKDISSLIKNNKIKNSEIIPIDFRSNYLEDFYYNNKVPLNNMAKKRGDCFFIENINSFKISMQSILYNNENLGTLKSPIMLFDIFIEAIPDGTYILKNHHHFLKIIGKSSGPIKFENNELVLYKGNKKLKYLEKHKDFICNTLIKDIIDDKNSLRLDLKKNLYEGRDTNLEVSMTERLKLVWAKVMDIHTILEILSPDNTTRHIIHVVGNSHLKNIKDKFEQFEKSLIKVSRKLDKPNKNECIKIFNSYNLKDAHKFLCEYKKGKRKSINDDVNNNVKKSRLDEVDVKQLDDAALKKIFDVVSVSDLSKILDKVKEKDSLRESSMLSESNNGVDSDDSINDNENTIELVLNSGDNESPLYQHQLTDEELQMIFNGIDNNLTEEESMNVPIEESYRQLAMLSSEGDFVETEESDEEIMNVPIDESYRQLAMLSSEGDFVEMEIEESGGEESDTDEDEDEDRILIDSQVIEELLTQEELSQIREARPRPGAPQSEWLDFYRKMVEQDEKVLEHLAQINQTTEAEDNELDELAGQYGDGNEDMDDDQTDYSHYLQYE